MKIENIALRELFLQTICAAAEEAAGSASAASESEIPYSLTGGNGGLRTLAKCVGGSESLLHELAGAYESSGQSSLAAATLQIAAALEDESLLTSVESTSPQRLLDFVYPVV